MLVNGFIVLGGKSAGEQYYAAAHINSVTLSGVCGGTTGGAVPEPGSLALLGLVGMTML